MVEDGDNLLELDPGTTQKRGWWRREEHVSDAYLRALPLLVLETRWWWIWCRRSEKLEKLVAADLNRHRRRYLARGKARMNLFSTCGDRVRGWRGFILRQSAEPISRLPPSPACSPTQSSSLWPASSCRSRNARFGRSSRASLGVALRFMPTQKEKSGWQPNVWFLTQWWQEVGSRETRLALMASIILFNSEKN
jgi:hypothetical protein